jgi:hypothetical protein
MSLVNFTNLDFDQIKTSIKEYLRSNSNFTDYDFEGSNLSVLIDTLAYNTYISSYNANMLSNEVFIDSATLRENVVSLARNIGYIPKSRTASRANISLFVDTTDFTTNPLTLTLKKGVVATTPTIGDQGYSFCILSDITVPVVNGIAIFEDVAIYEGNYITENFTVSSENKNQKFILSNPGIDTSLISISVRDNESSTTSRKFIRSDNLFSITSSSRVFFIQEIDDERYEIIFGDGVFGEKLNNLNYIEASYILTNAESANGVNSFTFNGRILDNSGLSVTSGISLITTNTASSGGQEIESINSIKKYAPRFYSTQNRAVTASDYEVIIPRIYPEAQSVSVYGGETLDPPEFGRIFVSVKPFNGTFIPQTIKENLKVKLRDYSVAGIIVDFIDLKYLYVEVDITANYNGNLAPDANFVSSILLENIKTYSNSTELNKYGSKFKYSKFQKIIDDSHQSITSNITIVNIRRDLNVLVNQLAEYEICFGNTFYVKRSQGYNIKSSGFNISGFTDTVYLTDLPNEDNRTGTIFIFSSKTGTDSFVVRRSAGTIDYIKGEIILSPINITSTQKKSNGNPIIEISAVPLSNDVVGKQDLYLQLDINKSKLKMKLDEIETGYDTSASLYTPSTSYTNGILIRK